MVHIITYAAQKLHSEKQNIIWAVQKICAFGHLWKGAKKKKKYMLYKLVIGRF